ncbi:aminotransferase class I/II-fold pyridoxal phosphate-dependent enzyme [Laedolimicola intestinihominis]|uniref:Aminotransferase class I/II-fold pyridoxal phosphate-dependent enzyme n=1 Tax=Laedolimicola intestinihominis TaxID=3133166 RepID=A0ABV1FIA4_9FIRM
MNFIFSKRAEAIEEGIFAALAHKKNELAEKGMEVYNFSIGTPDFQPPKHVVDAMVEACKDPENYKYAITDRPELIKAMQDFYQTRFGVSLEADEIMTLYGSQEGMAHVAVALCDPGDIMLAPNPGYPVFSLGPQLAGAKIETYPLYAENNFLPRFEDIPAETARAAKFMIVSYPSNPVCSVADDAFYEELIAFAKKYNIIILHDNAYSDIIYDGREGKSFLSYPGAKEVGIEFYSLSKSYNMTGMRMSFAVGNREIIREFSKVRSQIDYGIFLPIQMAAVAALTGPQDSVKEQCAEYERRNKALCGGLRSIGWNVPDSQGTMFVWAPLPEGYTDSAAFTMELMEKTGMIVTPGSAFGDLGEGYVRMALVHPVPVIEKAIARVQESGILKK